MNLQFTAAKAMEYAKRTVEKISFTAQEEDAHFGPRIVPGELRGWLARLRLLQGVPFSYLVADAQLLPRESIRFFYLDRETGGA